MRRRRRIVVFCFSLLALIIGAGFLICKGPNDPVYKGKRLSEWLSETNGYQIIRSAWELTPEAHEAVRELGTNAIPYLMHEFKYHESKWWGKCMRSKFAVALNIERKPGWLRRQRATTALSALGDKLSPAYPQLARYFDDPERCGLAMQLLTLAGPLGSPFAAKGLYSTNVFVIRCSILALSLPETEVEFAIPRIVELTKHTDGEVRRTAVRALGIIPNAASKNIQAVAQALSDISIYVQRDALLVFLRAGLSPSCALPQLRTLLTNADFMNASLADSIVYGTDPKSHWITNYHTDFLK